MILFFHRSAAFPQLVEDIRKKRIVKIVADQRQRAPQIFCHYGDLILIVRLVGNVQKKGLIPDPADAGGIKPTDDLIGVWLDIF